jgi:hypothetical protein
MYSIHDFKSKKLACFDKIIPVAVNLSPKGLNVNSHRCNRIAVNLRNKHSNISDLMPHSGDLFVE